MKDNFINEPMMEMYLFETNQQIENLEKILLNSEKSGQFNKDAINEIFRIMHTMKGSSAMMMFEKISKLSHAVEDLFAFLREENDIQIQNSQIIDILLDSSDFIRNELVKIENGNSSDGDSSLLIDKTKKLLKELKASYSSKLENKMEVNEKVDDKIEYKSEEQKYYIGYDRSQSNKRGNYRAKVFFEDDCEMENIRAFGLIHNLKDVATIISHSPEDLINDSKVENIVKSMGLEVIFKSDLTYDDIKSILLQTVFIKKLELDEIQDELNIEKNNQIVENTYNESIIEVPDLLKNKNTKTEKNEDNNVLKTNNTGMISVNVNKLDKLLDLVGELVISGIMVTQNSMLKGPQFAAFRKSATLHGKIINELQDMSMSLRMVPISATFNKMTRIIRDVSKKLDKNIELELIGEDTEIDKNIVESISDPLMHLVRNAADHGIEDKEERMAAGKESMPKIVLEAKNVGGEVWIIVKDNGKGLDKEKIYKKAYEKGITTKTLSELIDSEVYSMIFQPGFSTKESVTEFSGRGVGLDVVTKNIKNIGGNVSVDSKKGSGSTFIIKIPLTLAIIGGMTVKVGNLKYTIPTTGVRECFRPKHNDIIYDPDGFEMIMIRGECFPIVRIHEVFKVKTDIKEFTEGIFILVENEKSKYCIFADFLIGEQQVVVKALPNYINKKIRGVSGCTLLADGNISLIIDLESMLE